MLRVHFFLFHVFSMNTILEPQVMQIHVTRSTTEARSVNDSHSSCGICANRGINLHAGIGSEAHQSFDLAGGFGEGIDRKNGV